MRSCFDHLFLQRGLLRLCLSQKRHELQNLLLVFIRFLFGTVFPNTTKFDPLQSYSDPRLFARFLPNASSFSAGFRHIHPAPATIRLRRAPVSMAMGAPRRPDSQPISRYPSGRLPSKKSTHTLMTRPLRWFGATVWSIVMACMAKVSSVKPTLAISTNDRR